MGRDAPRRPSSVNRTSMGFLLSWWSLLDANCTAGESSGLPPRPWTVTSKPRLLLSSSVQSRTWRSKTSVTAGVTDGAGVAAVSPLQVTGAPCHPRTPSAPQAVQLQPREGAVLLPGCGTGNTAGATTAELQHDTRTGHPSTRAHPSPQAACPGVAVKRVDTNLHCKPRWD